MLDAVFINWLTIILEEDMDMEEFERVVQRIVAFLLEWQSHHVYVDGNDPVQVWRPNGVVWSDGTVGKHKEDIHIGV